MMRLGLWLEDELIAEDTQLHPLMNLVAILENTSKVTVTLRPRVDIVAYITTDYPPNVYTVLEGTNDY